MNNDWDLSAIVRSCCERNVMKESFVYPDEIPVDLSSSPFPVLDHLRNELDDPFDELSRVYKPFYGRVRLNTAALAATGAVVTPVADDSIIGGSENKRRRKEVQLPTNAAVAFIDDGAKENQKNVVGYQALRGRRRKQPRLVMKMNVASLSEDSWNWRKYGQKPIFGSMNPRSYYRCSSFKGCAARKQVERCEEEPGMFIVTYIGDHTHRKSDAGTTGVFTISGDSLKPSSEANNENSKQEADDDIVMAMHALYSTGSAFSGGQPQPPPKSVVTAGGSAQTAVQSQDEPLDFSF